MTICDITNPAKVECEITKPTSASEEPSLNQDSTDLGSISRPTGR